MSGKKQPHNSDVETISGSGEASELSTLRQILFGAAQADIDERLAALEQKMLKRFAQSDDTTRRELKALSDEMHKGIDAVYQQVSSVDKQYDDKTNEIQNYAERLASELELSEANQKQEHDELQQRLDSAVQALTEKYDARFAQALEKLEQVTYELSSSKTDRKTLARLLATMAINLETDEQ